MPLQCFSGSDKHDCRRRETGGAAFDVHEFFSAQVTAETGFRDSPVAQRHRCLGGYDRVASMGDIGKGAAVNKGEIAFKRLHKIRLHGFQKQSHQSAGCTQVFAGVGRTVALNTDNQTVNSGTQIIKIVGQTQHSH